MVYVPKRTAKRQPFKGVNREFGCNSASHVFKRKINHGPNLHCDDCQNLCNELYIRKYYKYVLQFRKLMTYFCVMAATK